jgi:hypothetical protein
MTNPALEEVLDKLRQLFASEYNRGERDASQRIMQAVGLAASSPTLGTPAIEVTTPSKTASNGHTSDSRAPRGSVNFLIDRVLTEHGSRGASASQIWKSADEKVSYNGVQYALNRGQVTGRYRTEGGRWFLKEAAGPKSSS